MFPSFTEASLRRLVSAATLLAGLYSLGCGGGGNSGPAAPVPTQAVAVTWLKQTATPFTSVEPSSSETDLAFVDGLVGNATIIGLGEATHGSSEFQKMKHRLFEYLVEHKGVTAFGLEAQMGRCLAIDQFVQTGQGDATQILENQGFWVWSTQEMLDLVNWMRAYNSDPSHTQKLHFFGFDMQDGGTEMDQVISYLQPIDAQAATNLTALYAPFRPYTWAGGMADYQAASRTLRSQCHANIQQAYQWMVTNQAAYSAATGAESYALALQMAKVVVQNEAMQSDDPSGLGRSNVRDQSMAGNVDWYLEEMGPGAKVVLSAHNGHVNKKGPTSQWTAMGDWLSQNHGAAYFSLGFAFDSGSFNAVWENADGTYGQLQSNTATPAGSGSYEDTIAQTGLNLAVLDLRHLDLTQLGPAWFNQPHDLREIGAVWNATPGYCVNNSSLPSRFDALVFLNKVTATTFLPGYLNPTAQNPTPYLQSRIKTRGMP
ncbi:MAG: erythromycin esterase family protein [Geothrix sp.]|nr:erythromycin esterase family protein [Geothrix sp.]